MRAFEVLMLLCKVTFAIIAVMHLVVSTVLNIALVVTKIKVGTTEKTQLGIDGAVFENFWITMLCQVRSLKKRTLKKA